MSQVCPGLGQAGIFQRGFSLWGNLMEMIDPLTLKREQSRTSKLLQKCLFYTGKYTEVLEEPEDQEVYCMKPVLTFEWGSQHPAQGPPPARH